MRTHRVLSLAVLLSLLLAGIASAQPMISMYTTLDKSPIGPWAEIPYLEFSTIYVVVENADMMIGGASFMIEATYSFPVMGAEFPEGLAIGDIFTGVELGLTSALPQFGTPAVIATFLVFADLPTTHEMYVVNHPKESEILVADSTGVLHVAAGNSLTLQARIHPEIGLFFDASGTQLDGTFVGGSGETVTGYLMLRDVEFPVDSVTARLVLPAGMSIVAAEYPDACAPTGDLTSGARLDFDPPIPATTGTELLATVTLAVGDEIGADMPLTIAGDGVWSFGPYIYIDPYGASSAVPLTSTVSIPVDSRNESWSGVKALFR